MVRLFKQQQAGRYGWPPRATFNFYDSHAEKLFSVSDPKLDFADTVMLRWPNRSRTIILGITSASASWTTWTESRLRHIEDTIRNDLYFDGYSVTIDRLTLRRWQPCTREFKWQLKIRVR